MTRPEYFRMVAERGALQKMLSHVPSEAVIDRLSLEARLNKVEAVLAASSSFKEEPLRVLLTFHGAPVIGSHGMFAKFGAAAVSQFADVMALLAASQDREWTLASTGPVPDRDRFQLLITGTALGSFGFELEHRPADAETDLDAIASVKEALAQTKGLLAASQAGSDDELAETVAGTDSRALKALRGFLSILAQENAICAIESEGQSFRFIDVGHVKRGFERLSEENLSEEQQAFNGMFLGVLPLRRTFEFRLIPQDEVVSGKVGREISDAGEINKVLDRPVRIKVNATRVGKGKPRYVLLAWESMDTREPIKS